MVLPVGWPLSVPSWPELQILWALAASSHKAAGVHSPPCSDRAGGGQGTAQARPSRWGPHPRFIAFQFILSLVGFVNLKWLYFFNSFIQLYNCLLIYYRKDLSISLLQPNVYYFLFSFLHLFSTIDIFLLIGKWVKMPSYLKEIFYKSKLKLIVRSICAFTFCIWRPTWPPSSCRWACAQSVRTWCPWTHPSVVCEGSLAPQLQPQASFRLEGN